MAGHSKFSNIKHRKEAQDSKKSALMGQYVKLAQSAVKSLNVWWYLRNHSMLSCWSHLQKEKWRTGVNVDKKNSIRLAEVWIDEYKNYYYERFNYDLGDCGDITDRKKLQERLQCHSFDWFIKNVYPDLFVPGEAIGEIRSKAKPMCIDSAVDNHNYHKPVNMWPCHNQGGNQYWMLSKNGEIRRDDGCLDYSGGESVIVYPCHGQKGNQEWQYREDNSIYHANTQKCMETSVDGQKLTMKTCTGIDRQIWTWKRKSPSGIIRNN
nr:polypeptide N-acetylgalactosaminyltransferase 5 [Crassostrea gigas]